VDDRLATVTDAVSDATAAWANDIRDHAVWAFSSTAQRDSAIASPEDGFTIYLGDGSTTEGLWCRNTADDWYRPWNMPWGVLATPTSGTTSTNSSSTTMVDVSGASITTPTMPSGRRLKWCVRGHGLSNSASDLLSVYFRSATPTTLVQYDQPVDNVFGTGLEFSWLETTSSEATVTRKVSINRTGGSGQVTFFADSSRPWQFWVEDLGPSTGPV
jgi:hypothetical protein